MDAVCGNSSETDFHQEARYMARSDRLAGFSTKSIKQSIEQCDLQFDVNEMHPGVVSRTPR